MSASIQIKAPHFLLTVSSRVMATHLCYACENINLERLTSSTGYQLHENLVELAECANSCDLCKSAASCIEKSQFSLIEGQQRLKRSSVNVELQACLIRGWVHHAGYGITIVVSPIGSEEEWTPDHADDGSYIRWLSLRTFHGDPAEEYGVRTIRFLEEDNGHRKSLNHALVWLRKCLLSEDRADECSHFNDGAASGALIQARRSWQDYSPPRMKNLIADENSLPSMAQMKCDINFLHEYHGRPSLQFQLDKSERPRRLIQITTSMEGIWPQSDIGKVHISLLDTPAIDVPYAALTYRWGTAEPSWCTTSANISTRHERIIFHTLPLTLQQAIRTTALLGLRFLWIDSICIVQDDVEEWNRESLLMASIYQTALVTLAADSSEDSHAGLYNKPEESYSLVSRDRGFEIKNELSSGEKSHIFLFWGLKSRMDWATTQRDIGDLVSHSKLRDRGWCLQERILSSRVLHFASDQLYWQCHHGVNESEDQYDGIGHRDTIRKMALRMKSLALPNCISDEAELERGQQHLMDYWYQQVVLEYSHRTLTLVKDKLIAISGISKAIAAMYPNPTRTLAPTEYNPDADATFYIAGHFRAEILKSLCWSRDGPGHKAIGDAYRAPSWSWASQDSAVSYQSYSLLGPESEMSATFLDASFNTERHSQWGNVAQDQGWLYLDAKVQWGTIRPHEGRASSNGMCIFPPPILWMEDSPSPKEKCSFLVMPGYQYSEYVLLDDDIVEADNIDVHVVMLSEKKQYSRECDEWKILPGACLICIGEEAKDGGYQLRRIGFAEDISERKNECGEDEPLPESLLVKFSDIEKCKVLIV